MVAKGYTQQYGLDYYDTFFLVAKIASVRLLLSMVAMRSWPLFQLDIKNVFLDGDLAEKVYMEAPGFVAQGESGLVSMAALRSWPLFQLDIKNGFLGGDLAEEVYMEALGFIA